MVAVCSFNLKTVVHTNRKYRPGVLRILFSLNIGLDFNSRKDRVHGCILRDN